MSTAVDPTIPDVTDPRAWITCKEAARLLHVDWRTLLEIARRAPIRPVPLPGLPIRRFSKPAVVRLVRDVRTDRPRQGLGARQP
jgi:hypothetical protein